MTTQDSTHWTVILGAADGRPLDRETFAARYGPVIRATLGARWRKSVLAGEVDDAVQDVFLECFREQGALARVEPGRPGGFRGFLYGVTRNVARRHEEKFQRRREDPAGSKVPLEGIEGREDSSSEVFDRAWATSMMRQAAAHQRDVAAERGEDAVRRTRLLTLRFEEGLPIREIAARWDEDPARLHREYAKARSEFKACLREVMRLHQVDDGKALDDECARLIQLLS